MSDKTSLWLISFQACEAYRRAEGVSRNAPVDHMVMSRLHPAAFAARLKSAFEALEDAPYEPQKGPQSATDITRIYSAVEVPLGTLTMKELMRFERDDDYVDVR